VHEGARLDVDDYRRTHLQLDETGFFDSLELRPVVTAPGKVDLEIAAVERHGFGSTAELVGRGVVDLTRKKVRLRYANLGGLGLSLGGEYKWEKTQPFLGLSLDAYRPLGFPGMVTLDGVRARPSYDLEDGSDGFRLRTRGGGVRGRVVMGSRTVAEAGIRFRDREWDIDRPDTPDGTVLGLQLGVDRTFWAGRRHDLAGSVRALAAPAFLGGDVRFTRVQGRLVHHLHVQPLDGLPLEHGSIAAQVIVGAGSDGTPVDEMFAPGAASDMELPLRAHRQKRGGVLGRAPIARSIALANLEWRQRLFRNKMMQAGYVLFYDGGWMGRTARGREETLHDVGGGLRIGVTGSVLLRADFGYSLTDGKTALTAGIGQVF
jgi:outer membrane protein assembly factor BamA